jgi:hypothetical protein
MLDLSVHRFDPDADIAGERFHVSIGDNNARAKLFETLKGRGGLPRTVIHPVATISPSAVIGDGTFVAARAIVAPAALIGEGVIINHGAIVDHECLIGYFCQWRRAPPLPEMCASANASSLARARIFFPVLRSAMLLSLARAPS